MLARSSTALLLLATLSAIAPPTSAQEFAASLFSTDIFESSVSPACASTVLASRELMGAYQSCGGMSLFSLQYMPYQTILETNILPSFCSSNCTERLQSLRALSEGDCSQPNIAQGLFLLPTETYSEPVGLQFNLLRLVGGINIPTIIDIVDTIKRSACVPVDAAVNKEPALLVKEDFCMHEGILRAKPKLEARKYNVSLIDLVSDKDVVCTTCFAKQRIAFNDKGVQTATSLYNMVKDAVVALQDTQSKSCPAASLQGNRTAPAI
ncbi:hypothetical protein HDU67_006981 [Dinochytrium kinnereticum]|nr:hypothetical protein HDU67_006981 [Dinochytrium kinnereticum]